MGDSDVVYYAVVLCVLILVLVTAFFWLGGLSLTSSRECLMIQRTLVTIEKKTVSYYGLCGLKTERRKFLIKEERGRGGFCLVSKFKIPEGYKVVEGSEVVCGQIMDI